MCLCPMTLKNKFSETSFAVPCGRCPDCIKRKISAWSFRLMQEDRRSMNSCFLTLTYNDNDLYPITRAPSGYKTLNKRDLVNFFKRLRKNSEYDAEFPIRYYACGEYGSKHWRPHYHAVVFNCPAPDIVCRAWSTESADLGHRVAIGNVYFGTVTGASVGYVLKYMFKDKKVPLHAKDDRLPEFALMSKRLGDNYLTPAMIEWHKADLLARMHLTLKDGRKVHMPTYYRDKIYNEFEKALLSNHFKTQRELQVYNFKSEQYLETYEDIVARCQNELRLYSKFHIDANKRRDL